MQNNAFKTWHKKLAAQYVLTGCNNGLCGRWLMVTLWFSCLHAGKSLNPIIQ